MFLWESAVMSPGENAALLQFKGPTHSIFVIRNCVQFADFQICALECRSNHSILVAQASWSKRTPLSISGLFKGLVKSELSDQLAVKHRHVVQFELGILACELREWEPNMTILLCGANACIVVQACLSVFATKNHAIIFGWVYVVCLYTLPWHLYHPFPLLVFAQQSLKLHHFAPATSLQLAQPLAGGLHVPQKKTIRSVKQVVEIDLMLALDKRLGRTHMSRFNCDLLAMLQIEGEMVNKSRWARGVVPILWGLLLYD